MPKTCLHPVLDLRVTRNNITLKAINTTHQHHQAAIITRNNFLMVLEFHLLAIHTETANTGGKAATNLSRPNISVPGLA